MQFSCLSLYLCIVKEMRHLLLLLALLGLPSALFADGDIHAVIISGGRSKMFNHERYWNDCAFLYRTLRQAYRLPKDHITLLMADGNNPDSDMLCDGATGFASSPTDLDGDGLPDLTLAATRANLSETFRRLSGRLTDNDHLFVFITDHAEQSLPQGTPHLWLWGNEQLSPEELAMIIGQCHPATLCTLLGQCYAGAFVVPLQGEGCVIIAVCAADQLSWASKDRPYDEFVYHWTCAIAQHDEQGQWVGADWDSDRLVSVQETYDYACQHDGRPESPSLTQHPVGLANRWTFATGMESGIKQDANGKPRKSNVYDLQGRKSNNHL